MSAFITTPSLDIDPDAIHVNDRPDLGVAVVWLGNFTAHVDDAATARKLAVAFAQAADLLEAQAAAKQAAPEGGEGR
jgi:hypothetical protein